MLDTHTCTCLYDDPLPSECADNVRLELSLQSSFLLIIIILDINLQHAKERSASKKGKSLSMMDHYFTTFVCTCAWVSSTHVCMYVKSDNILAPPPFGAWIEVHTGQAPIGGAYSTCEISWSWSLQGKPYFLKMFSSLLSSCSSSKKRPQNRGSKLSW